MDFDQIFLYALILTRYRLNNIFRSFSTELWPMIDVENFVYAQYLVDQLMDFNKIL